MTSLLDNIEALIDRIAAARNTIAAGARVDLSGMEEQVETVCQSVREPNYRVDERVRTGLARMLKDLDALEEDLTQRRDALAGNSGPAVGPQAAAAAYGKAKR